MLSWLNYKSVRSCFRISSILILLMGIISYSLFYFNIVLSAQIENKKTIIVTAKEFSCDNQGNKTDVALIVTELLPEGKKVVTRYLTNSKNWIQTILDGDGQTRLRSDGRVFRDERITMPDPGRRMEMSKDEYFKNRPNYVGEDTILGYHGYRLKSYFADGGWVEFTYSPRIPAHALRMIRHFPDGREVLHEAVKIEFK